MSAILVHEYGTRMIHQEDVDNTSKTACDLTITRLAERKAEGSEPSKWGRWSRCRRCFK